MVPWVQALQLLWFERTNQRYFREVVETLEEVPEGDQRNMITTFVIDADVSDSTRTEDFLATAVEDGATWPNGIAAIVRSWAERPFGLYEVEDRVVGKTLWVRDLRTAERFVVEDYAELGLHVPTITPLGLGGGSAPDLPPDAMTEIALQMEERWMSEGVPALGGLTPRQAAVDPTRRGDLIALLSSFPPSMPGMITFDPQRLAAALGVDIG